MAQYITIPEETKFPRTQSLMTPRVDLDARAFDTSITQKGFRVIWEQGMYCSCYTTHSGQPDYNCTTCKGKGYFYFGAKSTRALITSIKGKKEQDHLGLKERGSAYLTPLSTDNVGFRDRFTFVDFTMKYSEVIQRGAERTDPLRYSCIEVLAVHQLGNMYKEGADFVIRGDRLSIEWLNETLEPEGKYAILYTTKPVYIAINPIHELRGTYSMYKGDKKEYFIPLPKQFQIRREDFVDNDDTRY